MVKDELDFIHDCDTAPKLAVRAAESKFLLKTY